MVQRLLLDENSRHVVGTGRRKLWCDTECNQPEQTVTSFVCENRVTVNQIGQQEGWTKETRQEGIRKI